MALDPFRHEHTTAQSPRAAAEAAMDDYRDQQHGNVGRSVVNVATDTLMRFQTFQDDARKLRLDLIDQRKNIADLLARLDNAITVLPDYDAPQAANDPRQWGR